MEDPLEIIKSKINAQHLAEVEYWGGAANNDKTVALGVHSPVLAGRLVKLRLGVWVIFYAAGKESVWAPLCSNVGGLVGTVNYVGSYVPFWIGKARSHPCALRAPGLFPHLQTFFAYQTPMKTLSEYQPFGTKQDWSRDRSALAVGKR